MILLPVRGREVWLESCRSEKGIEPPLWEKIKPAEMLDVLLVAPDKSPVDEGAPKRVLTGASGSEDEEALYPVG